MGRCASVHIEPLLVIEQLRESKRIVLRVSDYTVGIDAGPGLMIILLLFLQKQSLVIRLFQLLIDIVLHVLSRDDKQRADSFIETLHKMIGGLKKGLCECVTKDMKCFLETAFGDYDSDVGALPMPTRCWTTYLTFFGDNQQLSCTKADTCKQGLLQSLSDLVVCDACPVLSNPDVQDFACDALTGMCTCCVSEQDMDPHFKEFLSSHIANAANKAQEIFSLRKLFFSVRTTGEIHLN
jgi:hypothetical protein